MHPLVAKHLSGQEVTVADTCATIFDVRELDSYRDGLIARGALKGPDIQTIESHRAELERRK